MNISTNAMPGMIGILGTLSFVLAFLKQALLIFLMFKGIQVANLYLKNNKDKPIE